MKQYFYHTGEPLMISWYVAEDQAPATTSIIAIINQTLIMDYLGFDNQVDNETESQFLVQYDDIPGIDTT